VRLKKLKKKLEDGIVETIVGNSDEIKEKEKDKNTVILLKMDKRSGLVVPTESHKQVWQVPV
jgi:hypothetical protein